jgi:hypothetical protein
MSERIVGLKVLSSPFPAGIAVMPAVPFPSTEEERTFAGEQATKAAVLLRKASTGQVGLFRHLTETSPGGNYVVRTAGWIDTILNATKGLSEDAMKRLYAFDWSERAMSPDELHRELLAALRANSPDRK